MSPIATRRKPSLISLVRTAIIVAVSLFILMYAAWKMQVIPTDSGPEATSGLRKMDSATMEKIVRNALPAGTRSEDVLDYLRQNHIQFTLDAPNRTINASVIKPVNLFHIIAESDNFQFHFDDAMKLQTIDFNVQHKNP